MANSNGSNTTDENLRFSLIDDPWIPVTDAKNVKRKVSLHEIFEYGDKYIELNVGTLETIAIYRLLICIAQRALNGPKDYREWKSVPEHLKSKSLNYLEKWREKFYLFGDKPFMQIRNLVSISKSDNSDKTNKTDKLDFGLASGNSGTLFDQNATEEGRLHENDWLARFLLAFQLFSPGGRIGIALWNGQNTPGNGSSSNAPGMESNMLLTLLKGKNIFETIHWNMVPFDQLSMKPGRPIWEYDLDKLLEVDKNDIPSSYLGRLVPLSRCIRFIDQRDMILANGLDFPVLPDIREPMASVVKNKSAKKNDSPWKYIRTDFRKHPWRNFSAILLNAERDNEGGAFSLKNLVEIYKLDKTDTFDIWVGGITSNKAKILDTAQWSFQLNWKLLDSFTMRNYEHGVKMANSAEIRLSNAIKSYLDELNLKPQKEALKSVSSMISQAKTLFWAAMDQQYETLINESVKENGELSDWKQLLKTEIETLYERICPHQTARQLQAFAVGKKFLYYAERGKSQKSNTQKKKS